MDSFVYEREYDLSTFGDPAVFEEILSLFSMIFHGHGPFDVGYVWRNQEDTIRISTGVNPLTAMRYAFGKECRAFDRGYASYTAIFGREGHERLFHKFEEEVTKRVQSCK